MPGDVHAPGVTSPNDDDRGGPPPQFGPGGFGLRSGNIAPDQSRRDQQSPPSSDSPKAILQNTTPIPSFPQDGSGSNSQNDIAAKDLTQAEDSSDQPESEPSSPTNAPRLPLLIPTFNGPKMPNSPSPVLLTAPQSPAVRSRASPTFLRGPGGIKLSQVSADVNLPSERQPKQTQGKSRTTIRLDSDGQQFRVKWSIRTYSSPSKMYVQTKSSDSVLQDSS